jgi:CRP/FNR family transcriptional activator FtrB
MRPLISESVCVPCSACPPPVNTRCIDIGQVKAVLMNLIFPMHRTDRDRIRKLALFRGSTRATQAELLRVGILKEFQPHFQLLGEGKRADFLIVVIKGSVELYCSRAGRETTTDIIASTMVVGLDAVVRNGANLQSARTLTPCQLLMIPANVIRDMVGHDPAFARAVALELAEHCFHLVELLKSQKLQSGTERLATWILETEQRQGNRGKIVLAYDKRTLAAYLGMVPESLSRNLANLADHGLLSVGREMTIVDREALRQRAKRYLAVGR